MQFNFYLSETTFGLSFAKATNLIFLSLRRQFLLIGCIYKINCGSKKRTKNFLNTLQKPLEMMNQNICILEKLNFSQSIFLVYSQN